MSTPYTTPLSKLEKKSKSLSSKAKKTEETTEGKKKRDFKGYSKVSLEEAMRIMGIEDIKPLVLENEFATAVDCSPSFLAGLLENMKKTLNILPPVDRQSEASRQKLLDDIVKALLNTGFSDMLKLQAERWFTNEEDKLQGGRFTTYYCD